ncbi:MAG: glycosyltransferase [Acidobacteriota bacterium]
MNTSTAAWLDEVDVAVVSHNGHATLPRVLGCLVAAGVPSDRITLYDIASTDATALWLARDWPTVRVVSMAHNEGPNPARNRAIAAAHRPYLLLVDSDAYLQPTAPSALRNAMARGVGASVPVVVHEQDPSRIQYAGSRLHFICEAITPWADRALTDRGTQDADIGTAPGVCFLLNIEAARSVGGFDERYFMGKEDGEFCFRLLSAGFRLVETPSAIVEHGSRPRSTWLYPFQIRNRWHFMLKNYEIRTLLLIAPALLLHEPLQFAILVAKGEAPAYFRALRELRILARGLMQDRRAVESRRRTHDRDILAAAPLVVRRDVADSGVSRLAKRLYDSWLIGYWTVASLFLR